MRKRILAFLILALLVLGVSGAALAAPADDLRSASALAADALAKAKQGDTAGAKARYEDFRRRWLEIEDGIKNQSKTAYKDIEDHMAAVQLELAASQPDAAKLEAALSELLAASQRFVDGGYPADGGKGSSAGGNVAQLLTLLEKAQARIEAGDAPGAAALMAQFRTSWLDVEGVVLTQSAKVYGDAERDMVDAQAYLTSTPPNMEKALAVVKSMREYLAPVAGKTSYTLFDAAVILLREGLEALLVVVALLGLLNKAGLSNKSGWIWGGVGAGVLVSAGLAVAVKLLFGTGAFGNNNFLIAGWTGIFGAVMLVYVSYWLHSQSSVQDWQRYIRERSGTALATGNLISLAALSFVAVLREGTETVLFYVGMAASIGLRDLLLGLGLGVAVLVLMAVLMLTLGMKVPIRPFFRLSSLLVFYLAFKFIGNGVHALQLAGALPATVVPYLPKIDFLSVYPNWESTLPQLLLLALAAGVALWSNRRSTSVAG